MQWLKKSVVAMIGRDRANRVTAPYHDWKAERRTKQFLATLPKSSLRLNLGCGYRPLEGWINVDGARGPQVDVVWDLTKTLPFADNSCESIFCEHVIEHLGKEDAEQLLAECFRVLKSGGVARFSTPDAELFLKSYAGDRQFLYHPSFPDRIESPLDRVNTVMREGGQHQWLYDAESLRVALERAGFSRVLRQQFHQSLQEEMATIDSEERAFESLYIEAVK